MAMGGRKPTPVEQRNLEQGDVSHRPQPEPVLIGGRPGMDDPIAEPPEDLPTDAKLLWRRDVSRLIEVGIIDRCDLPALEGLAISYARAKQAGRVVNKVGHFAVGSQGQPVQHPALKIEREAWAQFYTMAEHYALTPVARTRLGLADLQRRSLEAELKDSIGPADLTPA